MRREPRCATTGRHLLLSSCKFPSSKPGAAFASVRDLSVVTVRSAVDDVMSAVKEANGTGSATNMLLDLASLKCAPGLLPYGSSLTFSAMTVIPAIGSSQTVPRLLQSLCMSSVMRVCRHQVTSHVGGTDQAA